MTLKEIAELPLLLLDHNSSTRHFLDAVFAERKLYIAPEIELQNIDILIEMAKIGLGVVFVPDICIEKSELSVIKLKKSIPRRNYGIMSLKQIPSKASAELFLDLL